MEQRPDWIDDEGWKSIQNVVNPSIRKKLLSLHKRMKDNSQTDSFLAQSSISIQLPLWPDTKRASPNAFLRSAVFPAIQGKTRRYLKGEIIAAQNGYELKFTGMMLDQSDFDVWLQAAHIARSSPLGDVCTITAYNFLKSIGRKPNGKTDYEWLKSSILRMKSSTLEIKRGAKWIAHNLIEKVAGDEETSQIYLKFDTLIIDLFAPDAWTALQWEERKLLRGKPLALWLHGYYSSHAVPYPTKIETLKKMSGSKTKALKHFKMALKRAFEQLEQVAGMKAHFDKTLVIVEKSPSPAQLNHLNKLKTKKQSR